MAKKRKVITEEEIETPKVEIPSSDDIAKAIKRLRSLRSSVQSASGVMGEYVSKLCEDRAFDKTALGIVGRLDARPTAKLAITWAQIKAMAEALGWDDRIAEEPTFDLTEAGGDNVREFRAARELDQVA